MLTCALVSSDTMSGCTATWSTCSTGGLVLSKPCRVSSLSGDVSVELLKNATRTDGSPCASVLGTS
jgi:hypothetical protein